MSAQGSLMSAHGRFVLHLRKGATHYYLLVPDGLPEPDEHLPCFFDAEVVRITGEANNAQFFCRPTASPQAPPRGQPVGDQFILMWLGREQYRFALPQTTTPPVERFTMEIDCILVTPPEPPQGALADDLRSLEIARFGQPLPSPGSSHPPKQVTNQIEIGYRLPETSRSNARATSAQTPQHHRGESSSATAARQPSGPRPRPLPPSFTEDTSNAAAAAAPAGGTSGQTALLPSGSSTPRSPSLRGGSVSSDSDGESGHEEGGREVRGREEEQGQ